MGRTHKIMDAKTGDVTTKEFTPEEEAEADALEAAIVAAKAEQAAKAGADVADPVAKLVEFLKANPDVLALVSKAS